MRWRQLHSLQQVNHPIIYLSSSTLFVQQEGYTQDLSHRLSRVERRIDVLKDHLHLSRDVPPRLVVLIENIMPRERDRTRGGSKQAHYYSSHGGLAATAFADQSQGLSLRNLQIHAIHSPRHPTNLGEEPLLNQKVLPEAFCAD